MDFGRLGRSRGDKGRLPGPGLVELFAVVVGRFPQVGGKLLEKVGGVRAKSLHATEKEAQEALPPKDYFIEIRNGERTRCKSFCQVADFCDSYQRYLAENPSKFDPRDFLKPAREAAMNICKARYLSFGCEGQAARIKPLPLEKMADRYAKGELSQVVK